MNIKLKKVFSFKALLYFAFLMCIICAIPFSRSVIISVTQKVIGRELRDLNKWNLIIPHTMAYFAFLIVTIYIFLYTNLGKHVADYTKTAKAKLISKDRLKKWYPLAIAIVFITYMTLMLANYDFVDDMRRIADGSTGWISFSRYITEFSSIIIHTNFRLNDLAPYTQILAIFILAFTSYLVASIYSRGNISFPVMMASLLSVTCPFIFMNVVYKFDSPYMAMSILFAVLPFLFVDDQKSFIFWSIVCNMLVMTSYQASNSVYIEMSILWGFLLWQRKENRKFLIFLVTAVLCYIVSLVIFKLLIMVPEGASHNDIVSASKTSNLFDSLFSNFKAYFMQIDGSWGNIWIKIFSIATIILFPINSINNSKQNKFISLLMSILVLILMFGLSFGAYLILKNSIISARAFMGFGFAISLIALYNCISIKSKKQKINTVITCCLLYGFVIAGIVFGNAYRKHEKYENFRVTLLFEDLNDLISIDSRPSMVVTGSMGTSGYNYFVQKNYNFTPVNMMAGYMLYACQDYNMNVYFPAGDLSAKNELSDEEYKKYMELPLIKDTYYHTIYGEKDMFRVELKNPQFQK